MTDRQLAVSSIWISLASLVLTIAATVAALMSAQAAKDLNRMQAAVMNEDVSIVCLIDAWEGAPILQITVINRGSPITLYELGAEYPVPASADVRIASPKGAELIAFFALSPTGELPKRLDRFETYQLRVAAGTVPTTHRNQITSILADLGSGTCPRVWNNELKDFFRSDGPIQSPAPSLAPARYIREDRDSG